MKIAVSAKGTGLGAEVDPRFGRAAYILIVDADTLDLQVLDNQANVNAFKGAGIQAAATLSEHDAEVLLTGYCGPNAFRTLNAAKIKVVNDVSGTVQEAIEAFKAGKYRFAEDANVDGHW
jgi:predicted Fe-Mo cluster-binding NifX family protein